MNYRIESGATGAEDAQDVEEEHDDVQEEDEGAQDVVVHRDLVRLASHDELRVHDEVDPVHDDPQNAVECVEYFDVEEKCKKPEENKSHDEHEE